MTLDGRTAQSDELGAKSTTLPGAGSSSSSTDKYYPRHDSYFFQDGNITFLVGKRSVVLYAPGSIKMLQVDGTLYCVHRYFFSRDSSYFSTKFTRLGVRDHESLPTIISLSNIERKDFEAFLSVIYPE